MSFLDRLDKLGPRALDKIDKLAPGALDRVGSTVVRLTPKALAEARLEVHAKRREEELAVAQAARAEADRKVRQAEVAATVNQPFLAAVRTWTDPETLLQQPVAVRQALTAAGNAAQPLLRGSGAAAITSGESTWVEAAPALLEHLLKAAEAAKARNPRLALDITEVLLAAKPASRASWRQRALAAEIAGDLPTAVHAHQAYLNLTQGDRLGVMELVKELQERDDRRVRFLSALDVVLRAVSLPGPVRATAEQVREALHGPTPRKELDKAVTGLMREVAALPVSDLAHPATQDVLHHAGRWHRQSRLSPAPLPEDLAHDLTVLRTYELRRRLAGSRVCLVSDDPQRLKGSGRGEQVDGYDVVVRFGPTRNSPADGGSRTDLQVIRHDAKLGWNTEAGLRLVLAERPEDWVTAMRSHLVPGRQHAIAEKALRQPLRNPVKDETPGPVSDAYQLIRLLDLLAVCESVDLIGFTPATDFGPAEQAWLTPRLERLDDHVIGVR
ncbi:glycosyltransferase family 29 protein [Kineosporia succinea]|uniref:Uncharacterized protein n=1 Tax=Kineosporia succinea TaxID=84632 RepID=A0ABT9P6G4_9ACTN|nr:hypothetical protein [Kineosporia succinea]MDP9828273.1 hypothetical protein [Kineosporia succinea]